jgi:hypothetical protein
MLQNPHARVPRVAEDHDRRRAAAQHSPMFGHEASLADGVQLVLVDDRLEPLVALAARRARAGAESGLRSMRGCSHGRLAVDDQPAP